MKALTKTDISFPNQTHVYHGKVREVYTLENGLLVMIASDRISAFDHILPKGIPFKGQVLNQIASGFLDATRDIVPNWKLASPDPMVTIGPKAEPFKVEMVIRGYLAGHAWREYKSGKRTICGISMPDGMIENQKFPEPIITPATKAEEGHDEDISKEDIIAQGIVSQEHYEALEKYTHALFQRGTEMAKEKGLLLVDTKYEFGLIDGVIHLIDEVHTPDSSRYFYEDTYQELLSQNKKQRQLSKEFVREWLIEHDFQGLEGQKMPDIPDEYVVEISERYIELYEKITGENFKKASSENLEIRIKQNVEDFLSSI